MDIYKIAAASHYATGDWCKCGERATDCWFLAVYYPYKERAGQALYEGLFGGGDTRLESSVPSQSGPTKRPRKDIR